MSPASKLLVLCMIIGSTLLYSVVERRKIDALQERALRPILPAMPSFEIINAQNGDKLTENDLISARGSFVHFWGTWCGPCEAELPEFVDFAEKLENAGVTFLLLAVNDEVDKVNRFIEQRVGKMPGNILIGVDEKGETLTPFGTVKVPETYLFGQDGKTLTKFVGPQDWKLSGFVERTHRLLSGRDN